MNARENGFYHPRTLTPKERAQMDNLRAENAALREKINDQVDALTELGDLIEEDSEDGEDVLL